MTTKSFPPADDFLALIGQVDWNNLGKIAVEGIDHFLAIVEVIVAYVAAFCTASFVMWQRHNMTQRVINMAQVAYTWTSQVAIPAVIQGWAWIRVIGYPQGRKMAQKAYTFINATCETVSDLYTLLTARQFTTL